jgi:hypothetical protein
MYIYEKKRRDNLIVTLLILTPSLFSSSIPTIVEDSVTMGMQGEIVELVGNPDAWRCAPRIQI